MVQVAERKATLPQDERARQEMDELRQALKQAEAKATREADRADRLEVGRLGLGRLPRSAASPPTGAMHRSSLALVIDPGAGVVPTAGRK